MISDQIDPPETDGPDALCVHCDAPIEHDAEHCACGAEYPPDPGVPAEQIASASATAKHGRLVKAPIVRACYHKRNPTGSYFDPAWIRFFGARLLDGRSIATDSGWGPAWIVLRESMLVPDGYGNRPRRHKITVLSPLGDTDTVAVVRPSDGPDALRAIACWYGQRNPSQDGRTPLPDAIRYPGGRVEPCNRP